ncbi:hypothetical protein PS3A_46540 [Pseudomonas sp. 3A(2025)]
MLTISAKAPAGSASKNTGKAPATCTSATACGLADIEVINQPEPTSCIQVPMFEAILASHNHRNTRVCRGFQGEVVGNVAGLFMATLTDPGRKKSLRAKAGFWSVA